MKTFKPLCCELAQEHVHWDDEARQWVLHLFGWDRENDEAEIDHTAINFCPFCGKSLEHAHAQLFKRKQANGV